MSTEFLNCVKVIKSSLQTNREAVFQVDSYVWRLENFIPVLEPTSQEELLELVDKLIKKFRLKCHIYVSPCDTGVEMKFVKKHAIVNRVLKF